jgi:hypothetical protein
LVWLVIPPVPGNRIEQGPDGGLVLKLAGVVDAVGSTSDRLPLQHRAVDPERRIDRTGHAGSDFEQIQVICGTCARHPFLQILRAVTVTVGGAVDSVQAAEVVAQFKKKHK